jgi:recombination protein RecA
MPAASLPSKITLRKCPMSSISFAFLNSQAEPSLAAASVEARRANVRAVLGNLARQVSTAVELPEQRAPERVTSGVAGLDELCGGLPRGAITEIHGEASTGRTTLMLAALAAATRRGETCALIDATDAWDPQTAAAAGVELRRVLWVRCNGVLPKKEGEPMKFVTDEFGNHAWAGATKKTSSAWEQKNAPLFRRLEQALRAADLLLQGGGFGMVAMDLAGLPVEVARRVPMTTWFRFKRAVEPTGAVLLVIENEAVAHGCASLGVRVGRVDRVEFDICQTQADVGPRRSGHRVANLLNGLDVRAELVRDVEIKKRARRETRVEAWGAWARNANRECGRKPQTLDVRKSENEA